MAQFHQRRLLRDGRDAAGCDRGGGSTADHGVAQIRRRLRPQIFEMWPLTCVRRGWCCLRWRHRNSARCCSSFEVRRSQAEGGIDVGAVEQRQVLAAIVGASERNGSFVDRAASLRMSWLIGESSAISIVMVRSITVLSWSMVRLASIEGSRGSPIGIRPMAGSPVSSRTRFPNSGAWSTKRNFDRLNPPVWFR